MKHKRLADAEGYAEGYAEQDAGSASQPVLTVPSFVGSIVPVQALVSDCERLDITGLN
jgi:hypothetical protein